MKPRVASETTYVHCDYCDGRMFTDSDVWWTQGGYRHHIHEKIPCPFCDPEGYDKIRPGERDQIVAKRTAES